MTQYRMFSVAGLCVLAFLFSAYLLTGEAAPFLRVNSEVADKSAIASHTERLDYGVSTYSKYLTLRDCLTGMRYLTEQKITGVPAFPFSLRCKRVSDDILATVPTLSYGWYVNARSHLNLGELPAFNAGLRQSQLTGPNEQWVAELRVALSENNYDDLEDSTKASHVEDLKMLANSPAGTRAIAAGYVANPAFRERITAIVEQMSEDRQRSFLQNIRKTIKNR